MKNLSRNPFTVLALLALLTLNLQLSNAYAQGTAFTYQGQLQNTNGPVHGIYNFTFSLFTTNVNGAAVAGPVTNNGVVITNGLFTVTLDFSSEVWNGQTNWLQIAVETNGAGTFTNLSPRQQLTPTPYAIYSENANTASNVLGTVLVTQLSGTVPLAQLPAAVVTNNETSVTLSNVTLTGTLTLPSAGTIDAGGRSLLYADGVDDFYAGPFAGSVAISATDNTGIGYGSLSSNSNGVNNTAIGYLSLNNNTNGSFNVASGGRALFNNSSGNNNSAYGRRALEDNTSGSDNTADGFEALSADPNGSQNVAVGSGALLNSTNENGLVAIGYQALQNDNAGTYSSGDNTAVGYQALQANTVGYENTAIGYQALYENASARYNTASGVYALYYNTNGDDNTADGFDALEFNTSGFDNTADGFEALSFNTSGNYNTADGGGALGYDLTGNNNTAIGENALGRLGGTIAGGTNDIALGCNAGSGLQGNESYDIDIGTVGVEGESGITRIGTPGQQTFTYLAGNVGLDNTLNVDQYGLNNGSILTNALVFGSGTPFSGEGIASKRTSGGAQFDLEFYTDYNNRMIILQNGDVGIGNTNPGQLLVVGAGGAYCNGTTWVNGSDRNSKKNFAAIKPGEVLQKVSRMPITEWQYKIDPAEIKHIGPMAQDFYAAFGLNGTDDKHISTVDEGGVALAAIQGLNEKLNEKDAEIQTLKQQNDSLAERLSDLETAVKQLAAQK